MEICFEDMTMVDLAITVGKVTLRGERSDQSDTSVFLPTDAAEFLPFKELSSLLKITTRAAIS